MQFDPTPARADRTPAPPRRAGRRWLRRIARAVLLLVGLALLAWWTRGLWLEPAARRGLARALRAEVSIGALECDTPGSIEVRELRARALDGSWRARIEGAHLRLDAWPLLRGRAPRVERADVDGALVELRNSTSSDGDSRLTLPSELPALPELHLRRVSLRVELGAERRLEIDGLALDADAAPGALHVAAERASLLDPRWGFDARQFTAELERTPHALRLASAHLGSREIARDGELTFDEGELPRDGGELTADRGQVKLGGRARFHVELPELSTRLHGFLERETLELHASCEALELARLPEVVTRLLSADVHGLAHGTLDAWLPLATPDAFVASARVALDSACVAGRELDSLEVDAAVAGSSVFVRALDARRGADHLSARAVELPLGARDARSWLRELRGSLELDVHDLPALAAPWMQLRDATLPAHHLAARVRIDERGATIESARLATAGGTCVVRRGTLSLAAGASGDEDLARLLAQARVDLEAAVDLDDLAALGALVSTRPWSGSLRGTLRLEGLVREARGSAELRASDVVVDGLHLGQAELSARLDAQRIELDTLHALTPYGTLDARGALDLERRELAGVTFELRTSPALHSWLDAFQTGATHVRGTLDGPLSAPRGALELDMAELRAGSLSIENLALHARVQDGRWTIDTLSACSGEVDVQLTGELGFERATRTVDAELATLSLAYGARSVALEAPVAVHVSPEKLAIAPFALSGNAGRVRGHVERAEGTWNGRLALDQLGDLGLTRWIPGPELACDDVSGAVSVRGGGSTLDLRARLDAGRVRCARTQDPLDDFAFHLRARWTDQRLTLNTLSLESQRDHVRLAGSLPLDPGAWSAATDGSRSRAVLFGDGPVELHADWDVAEIAALPVRVLPALQHLRGRARGAFDLDGTWDAPRLACALDVEGLQEHWTSDDPLATPLADLGPFDGHVELELAEQLACRALRLSGPGALELELDGALELPFRPSEWLEGERGLSDREWRAAKIVLRARASANDLTPFSGRIPAVRRSSGEFAADVQFSGTLAEPEIAGTASVRGGELRLTQEIPPLSSLSGSVRFDGRNATLEAFTGNLGAGPFRLSGKLDWSDPALVAHLELRGEELLLARAPSLRLRADAQLTFDGPLGAPAAGMTRRLRGSLELRDSRYARDFDLLEPLRRAGRGRPSTEKREIGFFSLSSEPLASTDFSVRVRGDNFKIVNNLLRASLRPELEITGTGAAPELVGDLYLERGTLILPAGVVELKSGTVAFERRDPLVPQLDLRGEARFAGYDVALSARGPYDDLDILLSSTPVLTNSDLMLLALSGRVPAEGQGSDTAQQTAQSLATFLGRDYLTRALRDESGSTDSLWSRIEFRQGREVTKSGGQTSELSLDLTGRDEFGRSSDARRAIYLRAERDAYDRANFGVRFVFRSP